MPKLPLQNASLLAAALEGLEIQRSRLDAQIAEVKRALGQGGRKAATVETAKAPKPRRRRNLSAAARARIAAAQKKRWADYRKKKQEKKQDKKQDKKQAAAS